MKLITNISDFYHGIEILNYFCKAKNISEGDQFLTLKPVCSISPIGLYNRISTLLNEFPIKCVGVIEAERSIFQLEIQNYKDQFIPQSFFHCHIIAKSTPDILHLRNSWIDQNEGYLQSFTRKEINNLEGLVCYISKQINLNKALRVFAN
jgi:hypothetical protein